MSLFGTHDKYLKQCEEFDIYGFQTRLYTTSDLAVYDLVQSLIHLMPHKNKIAIIHSGTYLADIVVAVALKNQQQIIYKKQGENSVSFIESLDSSTHFVFWTDQHNFTSETIYNKKQIDEIIEVCHRKKIYSICAAGFEIASYLEIISQKEQILFSTFIQQPNIFSTVSDHKQVPLYFSAKLKVPLLASLYQNEFQILKINPIINKNILYMSKKSSALAIKQFLNLTDEQAFTLSELPAWITDKWISWWPEVAEKNYIRDVLILSNQYVVDHPQYLDIFSKAETEIEQQSSWKIVPL